MADYNVNMKQWNGTSFDNVLPLAYNAKQLEGQSLAEVKQWVQDNGLLLYTGQYTGTGTYGKTKPTRLTFPFEPILFFFPSGFVTFFANELSTTAVSRFVGDANYVNIKKSADGKTISWYSDQSASEQYNDKGKTFYYAAIGGYDMGGQTEWTITSSGTWTVPRTGRYMLELYGGGGGGMSADLGTTTYTSGGSSCQHYDSINLIAGASIAITIGTGGYRQIRGSTLSDITSTGTSFGSYSVSGGGNTIGYGAGSITVGAAAGNYGKAGTREMAYYDTTNNYPDGVLGKSYGWGSDRDRTYGGSGAVYLKYLGA